MDYDVQREGYAQAFLSSRCGNAALEIVKGAKTVNEGWKRLRSQYLATGWLAESVLFSQRVQLKCRDCKDMEGYIARFRDVVGRLEFAGMKLDDKLCVYLLLAGLESEDMDWVNANMEGIRVWGEPPGLNLVAGSLLQRGWVRGEG